jgi:hypothetical protein
MNWVWPMAPAQLPVISVRNVAVLDDAKRGHKLPSKNRPRRPSKARVEVEEITEMLPRRSP